MDDLLGLIEQIYQAGAQPELWHDAMLGLAELTKSFDATMGGQTTAQVQLLVSPRTDPAYLHSYSQYYHARNAMQRAVQCQPVGLAVLDQAILDVERFRRGEFYNDWCRPQGIEGGASVNLAASGGWRATVMISGSREDEEQKLSVMRILAPHLCRAFQLSQSLHEGRALGLGVLAALDHIEKGAFVVDRQGVARAANGLAEQILGVGDGLFLRDGHLCGNTAADSRALDKALAGCEPGRIESNGASFTLSRQAGRSPLDVLCVPFPSAAWWPGFEMNRAMIFVSDRDRRLEQQMLRLRQRYGLTSAEASLAWEITRAGGRQNAAQRRGVSVATVRSQLSSIFDKTGVRRQAELVRLLLQDGNEDDPA